MGTNNTCNNYYPYGNLVLLSTVTASNQATVNFDNFITSTYDVFQVEYYLARPVTTNTSLYMRVGTGSTPTYDSGTNYYRAGMTNNSNTSTVTGNNGESETQINIGPGNNISNSSAQPVSGVVRCYNLNNSGVAKVFHYNTNWLDTGTHLESAVGTGFWITGTAVTSLQFLFSSGNVNAGTFKLYGVTK